MEKKYFTNGPKILKGHSSRESAEGNAEDLAAKNPGTEYHILETVKVVKVEPEPEIEVGDTVTSDEYHAGEDFFCVACTVTGKDVSGYTLSKLGGRDCVCRSKAENVRFRSKGPKTHTFKGVMMINCEGIVAPWFRGSPSNDVNEFKALADNGKKYTMTLTKEPK